MRNRLILCLLASVGLHLATPEAGRSQPPPQPATAPQRPAAAPMSPAEAKAIRLIEQLGSEKFSERERATEQLILLGLPAIPHLVRASRGENREVRHRSQLVLLVVDEMDFKNRLRLFEQDSDEENSYGLPGWERFREMAGNDEVARKLFVQMHEAERELLSAELKVGEDAADLLAKCSLRLRHSSQLFGTKHELPPIAATLFVATNPKIPLHKSTHTSLVNLCQQSAFDNAIASTTHRDMLRNILAAWIVRDDALPANDLLHFALEHNIVQSLPRARALADQWAEIDLYDRHYAVLCLAKFGGSPDLPKLDAMMADKTVINRYRLNNMTYTVEMRDLVLAALLRMTKSDPAEFGYPRLRFQDPYVFDGQTLGFVDDDQRQAAITKWRIHRMRPAGG